MTRCNHKTQPDGANRYVSACLIVPHLRRGGIGAGQQRASSTQSRLDEIRALAGAIALHVVDEHVIALNGINPSSYLGSGKITEIRSTNNARIDVTIVDAALSPVQQRNLERLFKTKVIDRTGLILEIFGARAQTREGRLQVELAHLNYQRSRLVRSWTHLERQRGGFGFLGGPGETQIESDRRVIAERIATLKQRLERVRQRRALQRKKRQHDHVPVVALVGYTNVGKSTLFNCLTGGSDARVADRPFATLDPTLRRVRLPCGTPVVVSDTVGFITDLPTELIAAFRATLEEVVNADLLLHVRDISHPCHRSQARDVLSILHSLGVKTDTDGLIIEVCNKIDALSADRFAEIVQRADDYNAFQAISATTGQGMSALLARIGKEVTRDYRTQRVSVAPERGADLHWVYRICEVVDRKDDAHSGFTHLRVRVPPHARGMFAEKFHCS